MKVTAHLWGIRLEPECTTENELIRKWQDELPQYSGSGVSLCCSPIGVGPMGGVYTLRIGFQPKEPEMVERQVTAAKSDEMEVCLL